MYQQFRATIIKGAGRGTGIGIPTANMHVPADAPDGVFASRICIDTVWYPAVTFIGAAHTFGDTEKKCETHIFDFDESLYGREVIVELRTFIRASRSFDSVEKLVEAIKADIAVAKKSI